jgi:hypothetical protein
VSRSLRSDLDRAIARRSSVQLASSLHVLMIAAAPLDLGTHWLADLVISELGRSASEDIAPLDTSYEFHAGLLAK